MSHRIIISSAMRTTLGDTDVRQKLTTNQCSKLDAIFCSCEPGTETDDQFHFMSRMQAKAFCEED